MAKRAATPIKVGRLAQLLKDYPLRQVARELVQGFKEGFHIPYTGPRCGRWAENLKSVGENESMVEMKLGKEIEAGRMAGPFKSIPLENLMVSPLGIVPKKAKGEFRLIHHLSWPEGQSVNDFIPEELSTVHYASLDDAIKLILKKGVGATLGKCDIKSAFRLLPVHPSDFQLLGIYFKGQYFVDQALPMGCSVSCSLFEKFSSFLEWEVKRRSGSNGVVHYLDDFLFVAKEGEGCSCLGLMQCFREVCEELGVPLAEEKTEGPDQCLTFLGIELNTNRMESSLPYDKLVILRSLLKKAGRASKMSVKEVQQLLGHLNFACRVVTAGRAFCRSMTFALKGKSLPHHKVRMTKKWRGDLVVWQDFLERYNGRSMWLSVEVFEWEVQVFSDASGTGGMGIFWNNKWCAASWPADWAAEEHSIAFLEFFPILVALRLWGEEWRNRRVLFRSDNQAVVEVLNRQSTKDEWMLEVLRKVVLHCLCLNVEFKARHVPGVYNGIADALSRFQWQKFRGLAPLAEEHPGIVPADLWNLGVRRP